MKLVLLLAGVSAVLCAPRAPELRFVVSNHSDGGVVVEAVGASGSQFRAHLGRKASADDSAVTFHHEYSFDEASGGYKLSVYWDGPSDRVFEDCIDFGTKQWYAGPEQKQQYWPIQKTRLQKYSIVSKEDDNAAISERYWLNSAGEYIYVAAEVPLFVDYHNVLDNHLCLIADVTAPYSKRRTHNNLKYDIWFFEDAKVAQLHAIDTYLGKPIGIPDSRMVEYPIFSTWARYQRGITEESLWSYANEIRDNGYHNAQFVIDDLWEVCYGSLTVTDQKLPNLKQLIQDIKGLGFRVTMWIHPFINKNCEPWYSEALSKGYLVLNEEGNPDTSWWNNNGSVPAYVDFTKPAAANWYTNRVHTLMQDFGLDSFKFDAGESSWSPQIPVQEGLDIDLHPGHVVQAFVRKVAEFGRMIEIRAGMRTQDLPVFVRMVDKDTYWGFTNGLTSLVTNILTVNLNGYPFILPDMIGGNGYNEPPSKELFIRWMQANVFMPSLQFSFVPWDHDEETASICLRYKELHAEYTPVFLEAMEASVRDGTPTNPPIWWLDPQDEVAQVVDDEFLLGVKVLAAPVMTQGAVTRDIYLPRGFWRDGNTGTLIKGPVWLRAYPAPLDTLPYFVLEG